MTRIPVEPITTPIEVAPTSRSQPVLPRPLEAVLLDVGGVFLVPDHDTVMAAAARLGLEVDGGLLDAAHHAGIAAWDRGEAVAEGRTTWAPYMTAYLEVAGVPAERTDALLPDLDVVFQSFLTWTTPLAASVAALPALAATGVRLGIVSNADGTVESILRDLGICQVGPGRGVEVGVVVDSTVVGFEKPDPRIFGVALRALGTAPGRAIHVGDSRRADVEGARSAGVTPVHLDPDRHCNAADHLHLADLSELVPLVAAARA